MYELYAAAPNTAIPPKQSFYIEELPLTPSLAGVGIRGVTIAFFWNLITLGKIKVYAVRDHNEQIIHTSCVIPRCYKFPFMRKSDKFIGPCQTHPKHRGKGIFPAVLSQILAKELAAEALAYLTIDCENHASIRSAIKSGFSPVALMKKDRCGRHTIAKHYHNKEL